MPVSRYRNCFCKEPKKDEFISNIQMTTAAGDHQFIKANVKYCAVALRGGGGPVLLWDHSKPCRIPAGTPKIAGHGGGVTDTDFHPFNQTLLVTGSSDCTVKLWQIPDDGLTENLTKSLTTMEHAKRILYTRFHPCASNVLAVADFDKELKLWDITKSDEAMATLSFDDAITDIAWNRNGSLLGSTCKDHVIRISDLRTGKKPVLEFAKSHQGAKPTKLCFVNNFNRLYTFGKGRNNSRVAKIWDMRKQADAMTESKLDRGSGTLLPFYEPATNLIFVGGKGESTVRIMEATENKPYLDSYSTSRFGGSAVGYCAIPKRACDTSKNEVMRLLRVLPDHIEPLSFTIPRRSTTFQKDLYPDCYAGVSSLSASKWFEGTDEDPVTMSMDPRKRASSVGSAPGFEKSKSRQDVENELEAAKYKLRVLKAECELYKKQLE